MSARDYIPALPDFEAHPLLRNGHAMTFFGAYSRRKLHFLTPPETRYFRVDSETHVLAHCHWQNKHVRAPTLILLHGLCGSAESGYVVGTADKAYANGMNVVRLNMRNCGGTEHLTPTIYHAGLTWDLRYVIDELVHKDGQEEIFCAGFSLGGNVVLKLAGEMGSRAPSELRGVISVSAPLDLAASSAALEEKSARLLYTRSFLKEMRETLKRKAELYPNRYSTRGMSDIHTLREFDDNFTAPYGGFETADHYYAKASCLPDLPSIRVPALLITAEDDMLVPTQPYLRPEVTGNPWVRSILTERGGHVAFIGRTPCRTRNFVDLDRRWAENRIIQCCTELRSVD